MVQILKHQLKKILAKEWQAELANILLALRMIPCATGKSPAQLLMGKRFRILLDKLRPKTSQKCKGKEKENTISMRQNRSSLSIRCYNILYWNFGRGPKWEYDNLEEIHGSRMFTIKTSDGDWKKRHLDQIIRRTRTITEKVRPKPKTSSPESSRSSGHKWIADIARKRGSRRRGIPGGVKVTDSGTQRNSSSRDGRTNRRSNTKVRVGLSVSRIPTFSTQP